MAWNFLLYYFNHSAQQIWSDGIHRKRGGKEKRTERKDTCSCGSWEETYLSLSLFPLSFFHYSRNVHLFAGLVDVAFSFQRLYAPTMGRRTEVSIPSPSSIPFFPLFSTTGVHPTPPLTGKSFTRRSWNFLIVPASPLFHEARPRAARLSFELPETAPSNGAKHIFPSLLPVSIHCAPPPPTCFPVGVATREGFLPPRSQFTEELIPLRSDGEVGRKETAVTARVAATE